ncbi:cell surface glycoprotein [Salinarchaeum sp. Harcht-Bsk1]|uniref:hypothetical protein n=1 Tax=Salinarchaeum sp. Harcht-Bsk1 TaxID=1333523 RepID=UPI00034244C2|nr:hypothetical protein [Salinarchaeum sp. Harcht-Bsk1]AGN01432.1 cell surface glycoprotein [Salinarchaeum sp. Harcht-Bsk1]
MVRTISTPGSERSVRRPWWRRLATVAALAIVVVAVAVATTGSAAGAAQADANESTTNESIETTELVPLNLTAAAANDSTAVTISGEGQTVTDPFVLEGGLLLVGYDHAGESNFQLVLWNESADEEVAYLANRIGTVDGVGATGLPAGEYSMAVTADGPWNLTLLQPNATATASAAPANATDGGATTTDGRSNATPVYPNATEAPATASGEGQAVLGPVNFTESVILTANHTGESNFQVTIWSENATSFLDASYAFNEIGRVDGAETRLRHTGTAWIVVNADGAWELSIE